METNALSSGPYSPSHEEEVTFLGAALPEPAFTEDKGPARRHSFSSHWDKLQAKRAAEAAAKEAMKASKSRAKGASRPSPLHTNDEESESSREEKNGHAEHDREMRAEFALVRRGFPKALKEFIVENLACFQTHHAVREECRKRFGLELDGRTIAAYDPSHRHCRLGPALRKLYDDTRKAYIGDVAQVAISHQAQRLRLVSKIVEKATTSKDYAAALKGLELAAKEMGGVLEGRSVVEHRGGVVHVHGSIEDARREVAMRLAQVVDGGLLLPSPVPDAAPDNPQSPGVSEG